MFDFFIIIVSFIFAICMPFLMFCLMQYLRKRVFMADETVKRNFKEEMIKKSKLIDKKDEFETVYNKFCELLNNDTINEIKSECRNKEKNTMLIVYGCIIIVLGIIIMVVSRPFENILEIYPVVYGLICLVIIFIIVMTSARKQPSKYKVEVAKVFLKSINPNIKYVSNFEKVLDIHKINDDLYIASGFRDRESNIIDVRDYMEYKLDSGINVKMVGLHLIYHFKGKRSRHYSIYDGVIANIAREKYVEDEILIERKKRLKRENIASGISDEFGKYFDVYSKDSNIHLVLPQSVQEGLVSLYKQYGTMFEISLKGNDLFIRFFNGRLFQSIVCNSEYSKESLYREYIMFKNILEIIERISEIL